MFFATYLVGDTDYAGDEWVYPGIVRFRPETIRGIAKNNGFTMRMLEWPHPSQRWALFRPSEAPKAPLPHLLRSNRKKIADLTAKVAALQGRAKGKETRSG
jgi:hypothetical protein